MILSESGDLYSDDVSRVVRPAFRHTFRDIRSGRELRATLRAGAATWPGGYTILLVCADGEIASISGLLRDRDAYRSAIRDIRDRAGCRITGTQIYDEGEPLQCAYTGEMVESSYGLEAGD